MIFQLFFDGSCGPINPGGMGAYGFVLKDDRDATLDSGHGIIGSGDDMSNNVAEYVAMIHGFDAFIRYVQPQRVMDFEPQPLHKLEVHGDSVLVINQMSGRWRAHEGLYFKYHKQAKEIAAELKHRGVTTTYEWISREYNMECDALSKLDQKHDEQGLVEFGLKKSKKGTCVYCGSNIQFWKMPTGKSRAFDLGTANEHWASCANPPERRT